MNHTRIFLVTFTLCLTCSFISAEEKYVNTNVFIYGLQFMQELTFCESMEERFCSAMKGDLSSLSEARASFGDFFITAANNNFYNRNTCTGIGITQYDKFEDFESNIKDIVGQFKEYMNLYTCPYTFTVAYDSKCNLVESSEDNKLWLYLLPLGQSEKLMMPGIFCLIDGEGKIMDKVEGLRTSVIFADGPSCGMKCEFKLLEKSEIENGMHLVYGISCKCKDWISKDVVEDFNKSEGVKFESMDQSSSLNGRIEYEMVKDEGIWHEKKVYAEYEIEQAVTGIERGVEKIERKYRIKRRGMAISLPMSTNPDDYKGTTLEQEIVRTINELNKITLERGASVKPKDEKRKSIWFKWFGKKDQSITGGSQLNENKTIYYILAVIVFIVLVFVTYKYVKRRKINL